MAARVTIAGADHLGDLIQRTLPIGIDLLQNGRSRMRFSCETTYEPDRFDEVVAYAKDGTTPIYGGMILQRFVEGLVPGSVPRRISCECVGFESYLDWCYITLSYAVDTDLQEVLDDVIAALPVGTGITLDATDYSTILLAAFSWTNMRASDGLRELCDRTGRVYRVSPTKVLSLPLPGGTSAPVNVTDATPNCAEITWQDPATPTITTVILLCGSGTASKTQSFVGTDRVDDPGGEYSYFVVDYDTPSDINLVWPNVISVPAAGVAGPVLWGFNVDAHDWGVSWDYLNHRLVWDRTLLGDFENAWTFGPILYTAQYPFTVTAPVGGSPVPAPDIQLLETRPDVFDRAQGQEIADGLLAAQGGSPRTLELVSMVDGWAPGQSVTVDIAGRGVDATFAVTDVSIEYVSLDLWRYRVQAVELSVFPGNYLDQWRALFGGSPSGSGGGGSSSGVSVITNGNPYFYLGGSRYHGVQVSA